MDQQLGLSLAILMPWQGSFFPQIFRHVTEHTENHITNYKNGVGFVQLGTVSFTAVGCQIHYGLHF